MRKGLIGAAAAAFDLARTSARAQPAPGSTCDFVQGAIIEGGDHFDHMKGNPSSVPDSWDMRQGFGARNATSCGIGPGGPGKLVASCFWETNPGVKEADARKLLAQLTQEVAACIGSGRKQFADDDGGATFADNPTHIVALTSISKNDDGA